MTVSDATVQRVLLAKRLLTKEQIESAVLLAPSLGKSFLETILLKNYLPESVLGPAIAESLGVPYVNLAGQKIAGGLLDLIPEATATNYQIIGFSRQGDTLAVAMADPGNFEAINFLQKKTGLTVKPFFAFESQIQTALGQYKRNIQLEVQSLLASVEVNQANLAKVAEELPTIKLLETILDYAIAEGASDIHFEGQENSTLVRFRLDGRLKDVLVLESRVQPAVIARIKYLSNLKI
ncbi:MAG: putative type II secretion system protein E, partial [Candidatus Berkelbacteria bacterium Gr01-1014_85]